MKVREELSAVFARVAPCRIKLAAGCFALNDEERVFSELVGGSYPNVGTSCLLVMSELPRRFKLDVLGAVTLCEEATNALEHNEVLQLGEVRRGGGCDRDAGILVEELAVCAIDAELCANGKCPAPRVADHVLGESQDYQ